MFCECMSLSFTWLHSGCFGSFLSHIQGERIWLRLSLPTCTLLSCALHDVHAWHMMLCTVLKVLCVCVRMKHSIADYFITENEEGEETHFEEEPSKTLAESQRFSFILNETPCGPKLQQELKPTQLLVDAEWEHSKLPTPRSQNWSNNVKYHTMGFGS